MKGREMTKTFGARIRNDVRACDAYLWSMYIQTFRRWYRGMWRENDLKKIQVRCSLQVSPPMLFLIEYTVMQEDYAVHSSFCLGIYFSSGMRCAITSELNPGLDGFLSSRFGKKVSLDI
jgi:hypothetical protein